MKYVVFFLTGLVFQTGMCFSAFAQEKKAIHIAKKDTIHKQPVDTAQTDLADVFKSLLHIKKSSQGNAVTTRPTFSVIPALGYTLQSRLVASLSGNMAFRTAPEARMSTVSASAAYTQNKQFTAPIESNIWLRNNDYVLIGDYRFYKYPQSTYGLGSSSNINNENPMQYNFVRFYETLLKHISGNFFGGAGYIIDIHTNILSKGPLGAVSDYSNYENAGHTVSSGITLNGLFDSRDNSINPSKGFYTALQYRDSYRALGSTSAWRSLIIDVRKYYKFPEDSENVIALWSYNWLIMSGKPPYFDLPSTSWDPYSSTGRGYIQGRFRGAQMVYLETEYRYKITNNGLIGGVIFVNAESFSAAPGTRLQAIQPGIGPGLRVKLNKISKTNICIDYGFGRQSSRGFFVNVGELF